MKYKIVQAVSYYFMWFLGIWFASQNKIWLLPMLLVLFIQGYLFFQNKVTQHQGYAVIILAISGFLIDTLINYCGLIKFSGASLWIFAPYWLLLIWFSLIMTFLFILHKHIEKVLLWSSLSIFFFPLTYYSGCQMGAGSWEMPIAASIAYAIFGGLYFIYFNYVFQFFNTSDS